MTKPLTIAIDFDGTVVEHLYPSIGAPVPRALEILTSLQQRGHRLILWTMRSGPELHAAYRYLNDNGIQLYGINENPQQKSRTASPKAFAHLYIDDAALGCPLISPGNRRPYVDWNAVEKLLMASGAL